MKPSNFLVLLLVVSDKLTSPSRLDYLTNYLGNDVASSKKLILQKESSR
jgi:hypothetical protein